MIEIENADIILDSGFKLHNISFTVKNGEICVILGKNGSGKTTLLKAIAGLVPTINGSSKIDGIESGKNLYKGNKSLLGYVFQKGGLFDSMSVKENISFSSRNYKIQPEDYIWIKNTTNKMGIDINDERSPAQFSGGMQKRVAFARALYNKPSNLLCDDPTAGLDPILTDSIALTIREIRDLTNAAICVVTHDIDFAKKISDYIVLLKNGTIIYQDLAQNFFHLHNKYADQIIQGIEEENFHPSQEIV